MADQRLLRGFDNSKSRRKPGRGRRPKLAAATTAVAALAGLSACGSLSADYQAPSAVRLGGPSGFSNSAVQTSEVRDITTWWALFSDPTLVSLVDQTVAGNVDLARAAIRWKEAREALAQSRAEAAPRLDLAASGGATAARQPPAGSSYSAALDASWTLDLFGGLRREREASAASLEAAGFDEASVLTAVVAEVARNYVDARSLESRIAIARKSLQTQDDDVQIAQWRAQAGLVSSLDVEKARAQRAQTSAALPDLIKAAASARHRIAVLTGRAPTALNAFLGSSSEIPQAPWGLAIGAPLDALQRRPDVRRAERNLASATARIGVAEAARYPSLTLTGTVSSSAAALEDLGSAVTGTVLAEVAQTLLDGGRLESVVRQRKDEADDAYLAYQASVLGALEDIENAQAQADAARERAEALRVELGASQAATLLARGQYRSGLTDFQTLLDAERTLLGAQDGLATARGDEAKAMIQLYLALGGGWTPASASAERRGRIG